MTIPTVNDPPVLLAEWVKTFPGYEDAMDTRWQELGRYPGNPECVVIRCGCQLPSILVSNTPPEKAFNPPVVFIDRKPFRLVHGGPLHYAWVGRCYQCKTIYWYGPVLGE